MTGKKPIALIISPVPSHPQTAGNRCRVFQTTSALQQAGYKIHFLWYAMDQGGRIAGDDLYAMQQAWDLVHVVNIDPRVNITQLDHASGDVDKLWVDQVGYAIDWLKLNNDYDCVWINYAFLSKAANFFAGEKTITCIDTHDALSNRSIGESFYLSRQEELKGLLRADRVVAIQEEEAGYFNKLGIDVDKISHFSYVPYLPETSIISRGAGKSFKKPLLTVGLMGSGYTASVRATQAFLDYCAGAGSLPFQIIVAGSQCDALTVPAALSAQLTVMGRVKAVSDFYQMVDLVINPITDGTGQKIKTVEAMFYDRPVIGTPQAFIGLNSPLDAHRLSSVADVVEEIIALSDQPSRYQLLTSGCDQLFLAYKAAVATQWTQLLAALEKGGYEILPEMEFQGYDSLLAGQDDLYLYGAGSGMFALLKDMPNSLKGRIKGLVDRNKAGQTVQGYPVLSIDQLYNLPQGEKNNSQILMTLLSPEWAVVRTEIIKSGFSTVLSAHRYLMKIL